MNSYSLAAAKAKASEINITLLNFDRSADEN